MYLLSLWPLLLSALCTLTSCAWLDHPENSSLRRELADQSKGGLGLGMFSRADSPDLTLKLFSGPERVVHITCCPPVQGRAISHGHVVMIDISTAPHLDLLRDPRGSISGIPNYGGPVVAVDTQGTVLARSIARFFPTAISLSPDGEHFALVGKPLGDTRAAGLYVAGFHEEPQKLMDVQFPDHYQGFQMEPNLDWSSDGKTLAFSNLGTILSIDVRTGVSKKIADGGAARWAPTGGWLSYLTTKAEAMLLNVSSGELRRIDSGKQITAPVDWSPDGKYLLVAEGVGSHVYEGCLWVYRISDRAWVSLPDYGVWLKRWYWIQTTSGN